jgi:predicted chitinase
LAFQVPDPWEGRGAVWCWDAHHLKTLADFGDIEGIGHVIISGLNGLAEGIK